MEALSIQPEQHLQNISHINFQIHQIHQKRKKHILQTLKLFETKVTAISFLQDKGNGKLALRYTHFFI